MLATSGNSYQGLSNFPHFVGARPSDKQVRESFRESEYCYMLVGAFEAKPGAGLISNESPVGKALLGHKVGDVVIISTPGGVKETILSIE